jgi:hypothetical protein
MRKIIICTILLVMIASLPAFSQANEKWLGLGFNFFKQFLELKEGKPFGNMIWGFNGRLKLNENLGIILDIIWAGTYYYYQDVYGDFYGPELWDEELADDTTGITDPWEYEYRHSEFVVFPDFALFIPIGIFQPYAAVGPALYIYTRGDGFDNEDFYDYYDTVKKDAFSFGIDAKLGCDFFIVDFISLGFEFNFIVANLSDLFEGFENDPDAMIRNSWIGITALIWL